MRERPKTRATAASSRRPSRPVGNGEGAPVARHRHQRPSRRPGCGALVARSRPAAGAVAIGAGLSDEVTAPITMRRVGEVEDRPVGQVDPVDDVPAQRTRVAEQPVAQVAERAAEQQPEADRPAAGAQPPRGGDDERRRPRGHQREDDRRAARPARRPRPGCGSAAGPARRGPARRRPVGPRCDATTSLLTRSTTKASTAAAEQDRELTAAEPVGRRVPVSGAGAPIVQGLAGPVVTVLLYRLVDRTRRPRPGAASAPPCVHCRGADHGATASAALALECGTAPTGTSSGACSQERPGDGGSPGASTP